MFFSNFFDVYWITLKKINGETDKITPVTNTSVSIIKDSRENSNSSLELKWKLNDAKLWFMFHIIIGSWQNKNITIPIPKWRGSKILLNVLFHKTKRKIPKPYKIALYLPRQDSEKKNMARYQKKKFIPILGICVKEFKKIIAT